MKEGTELIIISTISVFIVLFVFTTVQIGILPYLVEYDTKTVIVWILITSFGIYVSVRLLKYLRKIRVEFEKEIPIYPREEYNEDD